MRDYRVLSDSDWIASTSHLHENVFGRALNSVILVALHVWAVSLAVTKVST